MNKYPTFIKGKKVLAANTWEELVLVPTTKEFGTAQIVLANDAAGVATIKIAVSEAPNGTGVVTEDLIEAGSEVVSKGLLTRWGIPLGGGEKIYINSSLAGVVARVSVLAHDKAGV